MRAGEHPEELIDRAGRGALDPDEQAMLERHLEACSVCALQLSLASRFERELASQPRDPLLSERALERAMQVLQGAPRIGRVRRSPRWSRWAAAALLVFGVTAAAAVIKRRIAPRPAVQAPMPAVTVPAPVEPTERVEPPAVEASVIPEEPPIEPTTKAPSARGAAHLAITAEVLFERAEKLRRAGRAEAAIATYRRLQAGFPGTAEARLSFALAGTLLLERGRPGEALAQFDRHLGAGREAQHDDAGEVGEEALAGRATALEQLHRTSEAIAAWKSLLARYPRSVYAGRARARLDQLIDHR
jgi:tetratricopeptide (TPR) repeat protein